MQVLRRASFASYRNQQVHQTTMLLCVVVSVEFAIAAVDADPDVGRRGRGSDGGATFDATDPLTPRSMAALVPDTGTQLVLGALIDRLDALEGYVKELQQSDRSGDRSDRETGRYWRRMESSGNGGEDRMRFEAKKMYMCNMTSYAKRPHCATADATLECPPGCDCTPVWPDCSSAPRCTGGQQLEQQSSDYGCSEPQMFHACQVSPVYMSLFQAQPDMDK